MGNPLSKTKNNIHRIVRLGSVVFQNQLGFEKHIPKPFMMSVEVTHRCNARCSYCDSWKTPAKEVTRELSKEDHEALLIDAKNLGLRLVSYSGGEPFVREDFLSIAKAAKNLDLQVNVNTNGYLISKNNVNEIISTFSGITVSIDSIDNGLMEKRRGHSWSLEKALAGLELLVENRKSPGQVRVNTVIDKENYPQLSKLESYLKERSVPLILQPTHETGIFGEGLEIGNKDSRSEKETISLNEYASSRASLSKLESAYFKPFYRGAEKHLENHPPWFRCFAGSFAFQVDPYGKVLLCQTQRKALGNLKEQSLTEIWNNLAEVRTEVSSDKRDCSCWLQCTTLNYLHADWIDRVSRKMGIDKILSLFK